MNRQAKNILRGELKAKGITNEQISEMFSEWNENVKDTAQENKWEEEDEE
ncbi:hypothetical protein GOV10_03000 [Candidatus Woesearchaeota archaeon]|nr:hypothetical protein [Candidatus Woesearchaeota archaeon]